MERMERPRTETKKSTNTNIQATKKPNQRAENFIVTTIVIYESAPMPEIKQQTKV
jgi:hypothetical protein